MRSPEKPTAGPATREPVRILVVGQTPPPYGGQAVMIEQLLAGRYERICLFHVRLAFSEDMQSVGKFSFTKIGILVATVARIWIARFRYRTTVLYYPPAGPNMAPVLRDIAILICTRWIFRRVVFHFHAAGVSGFGAHLPAPLRPLFHVAYGRPALAIRTASQNPDDGGAFGALRNVVIPYGIEDMRGSVAERTQAQGAPLTILFTGILIPSKGVRILLEAFDMLLRKGADVRLQLMGAWGEPAFEQEAAAFIASNGLDARVELLGVQQGREKFATFAACDIFCFPSFFEAESFGLVLLEAMQFAKPVVSTWWRGIPSVVADGVSGFLVQPRDATAVFDRLMTLVADPSLRDNMGREGRRIFRENFTLERFQANMEDALAGTIESRVE